MPKRPRIGVIGSTNMDLTTTVERMPVWGENYDRLLAVKSKYDPDGLFFLHHGVGSEDWSADGFTRLN